MSFLNLAYIALVMRDYTAYGLLVDGVLFSAVMLLSGMFILYARRLKFSVTAQEIIITAILVSIIIFVIYSYGDNGSITVWAFSFIMIVVATVFTRPQIMLAGALAVSTAQFVLATQHGVSYVKIEPIDYYLRVIAIALTAMLTLFINRIYVHRLRQSTASLRFQKALAELSTGLQVTTRESFDEMLVNALSTIAGYLQQRTAIHLEISPSGTIDICHHSKCDVADPQLKEKMAKAAYVGLLNQYAYYEQGQTYYASKDYYDRHSDIGQYFTAFNIESVMFSSFSVKEDKTHLFIVEMESRPEEVTRLMEDFVRIAVNDLASFFVRSEAQSEHTHMAFYDRLTGLLMRERFMQLVQEQIDRIKPGEPLAIMFLDVDAFKEVNDTAGHYIGNQVIRAVADRLSALKRPDDLIARYGGDDFLFSIIHRNDASVETMAEQILASFAEPVTIQKSEFYLTASMGITNYPEDGGDAVTLLNNADFAMYDAKRNGRNQFSFYSRENKDMASTTLRLKKSLRGAQERGEFFLVYQPQVDLKTEEVVGVEALLRWRHPEFGLVSPAEFIPVAEQSGMISRIGELVLEQACAQAQAWINAGHLPVRMCVNFTFQQLQEPNLLSRVVAILQRTRLNPMHLEIEITESTTGMYGEQIMAIIAAFKQMGITLAIDDYGSDYSGLRRLSVFAVDRIKIDKALIDDILVKKTKRKVIVENIIILARELNLDVVAEGVETAEQAELLRKLGCDIVQGYYYYRPLLPAEISSILHGQRERN